MNKTKKKKINFITLNCPQRSILSHGSVNGSAIATQFTLENAKVMTIIKSRIKNFILII